MDSTTFLNIDLDLVSAADISPIVESFGDDVSVLRNELENGTYHGSFETGYTEPNEIINEYHRLVQGFNQKAKEAWNRCDSIIFDIGYEAGKEPYAFQSKLLPSTITKLSELGGECVITVYAHDSEYT